MKVAVVAPLPPIRSGIAIHSHNLIEALRSGGHTVVAYSWDRQYPSLVYRRPQVDEQGLWEEGAQRSLHWAKPWSWRQTGIGVRESADVMVLPWVTPFHALVFRSLMAHAAIPTVVMVHNARPHEWFPATGLLSRVILNRAQRIIAHSTTVVEDLRRFGVTTPAVVVPHPANLQLSHTAPPPGPPTRLLFLGFVRPYKGLDLLIRALTLLPDDFRLTVAGEFWGGRKTTDKMVDELGLTARVEIEDRYVSDDEIRSLLAAHHLLVAPYRTATQSGIVPLAFAAGRPVVATAVGGLGEVVTNHQNGILCDPDPSSIAEAVLTASSEYEELIQGVSKMSTSWADVADSIVEAGVG